MSCYGRYFLLALGLWLISSTQRSWSAPPPAARPFGGTCLPCPSDGKVRWDWYFRESLLAIRDWEAILAAREKTTPEAEPAPVFPVPSGGEAVEWPNPIPLVLLPAEDRDQRVSVRLVDGKVHLERTGRDGEAQPVTASPGETVLGYKHPGGGGKDQWYHKYHRRFDQLTAFRAKPAPLAIELEGPLDLGPLDLGLGRNELAVGLRNVSAEPLTLLLQLRFHSPKQTRPCGEKKVTIPAGGKQSVRFPIELRRAGGGLLVLSLHVGGESFWVPLLTHVEDVGAVLESIEQIIADTPDAQAAARLAALRQRARRPYHSRADEPEGAGSGSVKVAWRRLFEEASRLRDELLLRRIRFDTLLFVKRKPFFSEQPFMDAHHLFNRPGGGIYRLSPVRPGGKVTPVVDTLGEGVYRDVFLHPDAQKFLFSFGNGSDKWDGKPSYHIYESDVDGQQIRRLTSGPKNDCEPFYLPGGQIGFTSDRSEHFVMCGGNRHSPTLFVTGGDGSDVRQLSFNVFNDYNPTVLPDGRILYSRWEYNERSVTALHHPFTVNPDGTMMATYYGNATIRPSVVMFPRPVPGSNQVMALFTAHHGQTHGAIGLIDIRRGRDGQQPLSVLTPQIPVTGERAEDSRHGWYSDPVPLSETTYLCSFTPTVVPWLERSWALYVGDRHGNLALVYRDPGISCAEPVPLRSRPAPHVMPFAGPESDTQDGEATVLLADVYVGLPDVPRGAAKYLRILEDVPRKSVDYGGVILTSGTEIFTIKRIFGTVPIEPDGSAHFVVPANRNVYFEVLDESQQEIQRMRSVVCLKPNERRTCIGCHEPRNTAPPNLFGAALHRDPDRPAPPPWGTQIISFLRDVQPVLGAKCVVCHTHDRTGNLVILTDDLTDQFTVGYQELLPYLSVANANRWDHADDVYPRPPYTYGSKVSRLMQLLADGHHDVRLSEDDWLRLVSWIDANAVYYDRYESAVYGPKRHIFAGPVRTVMEEVYARRCASCHGKNDGRHGTWWMSLNRHKAEFSRALRAPLARSAGGWGRCGDTVFADTGDPDYKKLSAALGALRDRLAEHPRADLLSIRGTPAERQQVAIPTPPPPRRPRESELPDADWVYLSNLSWESGTSGWPRNRDALPQLDKDIENQPLRLGARRYGRGIGTHAPSEIVYRLDGKYLRFFALVGAAEIGGTVVFRVFGDDKLLFDSGLMHGLHGAKKVDVPTAGVRRLRLLVTDAGDGINCDMANWAAARVLRRNPGGAQDGE